MKNTKGQLSIRIVPLSKKYLDEANLLVEKIFLYKQDRKIARINLEESLFLRNSGKWYWVAIDKSGKLVGVTGLYLDTKDEDVIWLGWFGVHPEYRRQGMGTFLFEFTIKAAKRREFKTIKIYTSTDKHERAAHRMYESYEFKKINCCRTAEDIYYIKDLEADDAKTGELAYKRDR